MSGGKLKVDDIVRHVIFTTAHAHLLFFSNRGKVYRLRALGHPERERTAKGMPIVNLLPLQPDEKIQAIIDTREFAGDRLPVLRHEQGHRQEDHLHEYDSSRRDGLIAINLRDDDELVQVIETSGSDDIFMVSRRRHDHPFQRERRAVDGSHRRWRARHEAEDRRRLRRVVSTSLVTTRRS